MMIYSGEQPFSIDAQSADKFIIVLSRGEMSLMLRHPDNLTSDENREKYFEIYDQIYGALYPEIDDVPNKPSRKWRRDNNKQ